MKQLTMHGDQRVVRRHAMVVAAVVLCLLFAGGVDGYRGFETVANQMMEPLLVKPDAQQYVQNPSVMPVAPLFTEPVAQQPEELVPVPQLITNPGAAAGATYGGYSMQNEPAVPSTAEGQGYATPTQETTTTQPSESEAAPATMTTQPSESEAAPATYQSQASTTTTTQPSESEATPATTTTQPSESEDTPATYQSQAGTTTTTQASPPPSSYGQTDADGEPTEGLSPVAIANILKEHNLFRAREHEPPLKWNATVAAYAQHYAEERKGDCALEHSTGPYGENLMFGQGKAWTWKGTVDSWSKEKKSYHYGSNTCDPGQQCGHYTAVVWKDTTDVGCGRVTCTDGDTLMVCSYWPPGNYIGQKPY